MPDVLLGGMGGKELLQGLQEILIDGAASVIGIASAFVSVLGVELTKAVIEEAGIEGCRLVAGTDYAITHPQALAFARDWGWGVRMGRGSHGVFHPKLIVAGTGFRPNGAIRNPISVYIGSGNLTSGGLRHNVECGIVVNGSPYAAESGEAFGMLWSGSMPLTKKSLKNYSSVFAKANRQRSVSVMTALGVTDDATLVQPPLRRLRRARPSHRAVVADEFAAYVWAELRSFTGQYAFQVEFPRAAGAVLGRFVRGRLSADNKVDVECEDGQIRQMTSRYYADNSMYRLNIPPAVPNVEWARTNRQGIALIQRGPEGGVPVSLRVLLPGGEMNEVIGRSVALGTWGKTTTRLYGWC
jgi:hypothetical protein